MIPGTAGYLGLDIETERGKVQHIDEGIDRADRIVLVDVIVDAVPQEGGLAAIQPFDEALHVSPHLQRGDHNLLRSPRRVFTQALCCAATVLTPNRRRPQMSFWVQTRSLSSRTARLLCLHKQTNSAGRGTDVMGQLTS